MNEIWRDIKGYEDKYQVSNLGRVRSLDRTVWNGVAHHLLRGRILKIGYDGGKYRKANISVDGNRQSLKIHRLVAAAFLEDYDSKMEVNHKDFDKDNNRVDNLEMVSPLDNTRHYWRSQRKKRGAYPYKSSKRFKAQIFHKGKQLHIGVYDTIEEAYQAYWEKHRELKGSAPW